MQTTSIETVNDKPASTEASHQIEAAATVVRAWLGDLNFQEDTSAERIKVFGPSYDVVSREHRVSVRFFVPQVALDEEISNAETKLTEDAAAVDVVRAWLNDADFHEDAGPGRIKILGPGYDSESRDRYVDVHIYVPQVDIDEEIKGQ